MSVADIAGARRAPNTTLAELLMNATEIDQVISRYKVSPGPTPDNFVGTEVQKFDALVTAVSDILFKKLADIDRRCFQLGISRYDLMVLALLMALTPPGFRATANSVTVDIKAREAFLGDQELDLTAKEFDLLALLVSRAGNVVSRDEIMRAVWDSKWWGSTKTLDMHVSWLRRKLGDDARQPHFITTVRGVGFRFERGD